MYKKHGKKSKKNKNTNRNQLKHIFDVVAVLQNNNKEHKEISIKKASKNPYRFKDSKGEFFL